MTKSRSQAAQDALKHPALNADLHTHPGEYVNLIAIHREIIREALRLHALLEDIPVDAHVDIRRVGAGWAVIRRNASLELLPMIYGETMGEALDKLGKVTG